MGVRMKGNQLQWPQLQEQALAGAPGPLVAGCWGEGKEDQKQMMMAQWGPQNQDASQRVCTRRASSCNGPSSRNKLWQAHQGH